MYTMGRPVIHERIQVFRKTLSWGINKLNDSHITSLIGHCSIFTCMFPCAPRQHSGCTKQFTWRIISSNCAERVHFPCLRSIQGVDRSGTLYHIHGQFLMILLLPIIRRPTFFFSVSHPCSKKYRIGPNFIGPCLQRANKRSATLVSCLLKRRITGNKNAEKVRASKSSWPSTNDKWNKEQSKADMENKLWNRRAHTQILSRWLIQQSYGNGKRIPRVGWSFRK